MPWLNAGDLPLWANASLFAAAAVIVWAAGTRLARDVDGIASQSRLGHAFFGMLLLGGITSLPEAANSITSSLIGNPGLGINNLLGSAAINVVLLAVVDAFIGRDAATSVVADPSTMMLGTLCMVLMMSVAIAVAVGDALIVGVGIGAVLLCAMSIAFFWISAGYGQRAPWAVKDEREHEVRDSEGVALPFRTLLIRTALSAAVILAAGYTLSVTGDSLAQQTGLGSGIVGFALLGLATSMPELSSITAAFRLRRYEMAFGQVLGTNFVNLSLILLADAFFAGGPVLNELGRFEIVSALLGAILIGIFMVGLLERRDSTIMRMGHDSLAVIILFACGLAVLSTIGRSG